MNHSKTRRRRVAPAAIAAALAVRLAACGSDKASSTTTATFATTAGGSVTTRASSPTTQAGSPTPAATATDVAIGAQAEGIAQATTISVAPQADIIAELPADVSGDGKLTIGLGALPTGFPPLAFVGTDDKTITGAEPDLGRLVAAVLGLEPEFNNDTWENLFVALDSGKDEVGFSNITVTEKRKEKYDFASYRQDNLGFAVTADSTWNFDGDYENLDGLKVAVGAGTNQEKILVAWQDKLKGEGKSLDIAYFADTPTTFTALNAGQIDAYFGPNPGIAYQASQTRGKPNAIRDAGVFSGAGESLQGLIAATTKKDAQLAQPVADAINYLIETGAYAEWLKAWNLSNEAVDTSQVNPPGLPLDNS